jgi:hypothetical protein
MFKQLFDMPHMSDGKGEMLSNRDVNQFVHKIEEKYAFFVHMEHYWDLLFQLIKTWDQHFTGCIYICILYLNEFT